MLVHRLGRWPNFETALLCYEVTARNEAANMRRLSNAGSMPGRRVSGWSRYPILPL